MLRFVTTGKFEQDYSRMLRSGKDEEKIEKVIRKLLNGDLLEPKNLNHKLKGIFKDRWECHIAPDWLLIYKKTNESIICERTGTHSDLFKS